MSSPPEPPVFESGPAPDPAPSSDERRRLLRGGLAAGPVLMTVMSRPVLGQTNCGNPSVAQSLSTGTSLHPGCVGTNISTGYSPTRWISRSTSWPSPYSATSPQGQSSAWGQTTYSSTNSQTATLFHSPTTGFQGTVFGNGTMLDVLKQQAGGAGYAMLGMYVTAALLNAAAGRTPFLSEATVRAMWNDLLIQGYYEPTAGIRWGATQVITYLQSTMH